MKGMIRWSNESVESMERRMEYENQKRTEMDTSA